MSSILWSHGREGGNCFASSSENKVTCHLNSSRSMIVVLPFCSVKLCAISTAVCIQFISTQPQGISARVTPDHGGHTVVDNSITMLCCSFVFLCSWILQACCRVPSSSVLILTFGPLSCASAQLMLGLNDLNQGNPRIKQFFPRLVTKNRCLSFFPPLLTRRSQVWVIVPC